MSEEKKSLESAESLRRFRDKKPRPARVLIALAAAIALSLVLFFAIRPASGPEGSEPAPSKVTLINRDKPSLHSITIRLHDHEPYTLINLNEYDLVDGNESEDLGREYALEGDDSFAVSTTQVLAMERYATDLSADDVAVSDPKDLAEYGLTSPTMTVTIDFRDGATETFDFGIEVPTGGGVYMKRAGDDAVYIASYSIYDAFGRELESLRQTEEERQSIENAKAAEKSAVAPDENAPSETFNPDEDD